MEETDVYAASRLEEEAFSMPWHENDFLEMISAEYAHYFVAEDKDGVSGIIGLRELSGEGEITNVAVDQSKRRRGIGRALVKRVLDECDALNIGDVTLEVRVSNEAAIALYDSFGFKSEGTRPHFYEKPDEDALILWRRKERC